jgi:hypothetical protein
MNPHFFSVWQANIQCGCTMGLLRRWFNPWSCTVIARQMCSTRSGSRSHEYKVCSIDLYLVTPRFRWTIYLCSPALTGSVNYLFMFTCFSLFRWTIYLWSPALASSCVLASSGELLMFTCFSWFRWTAYVHLLELIQVNLSSSSGSCISGSSEDFTQMEQLCLGADGPDHVTYHKRASFDGSHRSVNHQLP